MNLLTKNGLRGRSIRRVSNKECLPYYNLVDHRPHLGFHVDGADGIQYTIHLNLLDIERIYQKLFKYEEQFYTERQPLILSKEI